MCGDGCQQWQCEPLTWAIFLNEPCVAKKLGSVRARDIWALRPLRLRTRSNVTQRRTVNHYARHGCMLLRTL
jgi:hypothetical protein